MSDGINTKQELFPFYYIKVNGKTENHYLSADLTAPQKVDLFQELVDGIYAVIENELFVTLVDDEGLCKGKGINKQASKYAGIVVVGDAIVFGKETFDIFDKSMEEEG